MTSHDDPQSWRQTEPEEVVPAFRSARGGGVRARFARPQAALLRELVGQVAELVGGSDATAAAADQSGEGGGPGTSGGPDADQPLSADAGPEDLAALFGPAQDSSLPDDPALARLLPDAYRDDPDAAAEFRRYTESGLRSAKLAAARTVLATLPAEGGKVHLGEDEIQAWLRTLNDVRLTLGVRLNISEDFEERLAEQSWAEPRSAYLWVYQWLTYLQGSLVESLDDG